MCVHFPAKWCGFDGSGYHNFSIDTLPPLDESRFTGRFEWLGDQGDTLPEQKARIDAIAEELARVGLKLPLDFVAFQTRSNLHHALGDVSCCWGHVVGPIPSPVEPGAYLVQFLRDQQDCCIWYLYLRRGETFVVHSYHLQFYANPDLALVDVEPELEIRVDLHLETYWCAPTFEQFAYRFWLENSRRTPWQ